jgi:hypothetical protein
MSGTVVLDACCVINLVAADALDTWLGELGLRWMLPEAVSAEALFLRRSGENFRKWIRPLGRCSARSDAHPSGDGQ